jgi:uncharacterized repeat protein (TIGR03847 family)
VPIFELDPVEQIAVAAVGDPGQRRFFLLAAGSGRTMTLSCEKSQIQALIVRLKQMLEEQGVETPEEERKGSAAAEPGDPGEPEWQIGEIGLGYHEGRHMFVLVASEAAAGEEKPPETNDVTSIRFWLNPKQLVDFSKQAESVLTAGRPLCPRCGLPMDPAGHPCPVMNGARPIF